MFWGFFSYIMIILFFIETKGKAWQIIPTISNWICIIKGNDNSAFQGPCEGFTTEFS